MQFLYWPPAWDGGSGDCNDFSAVTPTAVTLGKGGRREWMEPDSGSGPLPATLAIVTLGERAWQEIPDRVP